MNSDKIFFRSLDGYNYVLTRDATWQTDIVGGAAQIRDDDCNLLVTLNQDGLLTVHAGYAWDGVSFHPMNYFSKPMLAASLFHDAGAQLIREGHLEPEAKAHVDQLFYDACLAYGCSKFASIAAYRIVNFFKFFVARDKKKEGNEEELSAP